VYVCVLTCVCVCVCECACACVCMRVRAHLCECASLCACVFVCVRFVCPYIVHLSFTTPFRLDKLSLPFDLFLPPSLLPLPLPVTD